MPERPTKQINLRIEPEYEALLRGVTKQIRKGGPTFREALEAFVLDHNSAKYLTAEEINQRFDSLEARLARLELKS